MKNHLNVVARARRTAARTARRLGLVPAGSADGLGEDATLGDVVLQHEAMVFFPDPPGSLYQLEQWYAAFRALDAECGVVVVLRDSRTARRVRAESGLDVVVAADPSTVEGLVARGRLRLAIYVNHHPDNFTNLRLPDLVHISLMHGDSDKQVSVSNQTKAYDFSFVAGQAAVERMAAASVFYDAHERCVTVGRPQVDAQLALIAERAAERVPGGPCTVLYAPTWEGPQGVSEYGSLRSLGEAVVRGLAASDRYRVIYRPHPLTGCRSREYAEADAALRELVGNLPGARVDGPEVELADSFADSDVLLCDVSGVAMDWLASGRPMAFMTPGGDQARPAASPLAAVTPWLGAAEASRIAEVVDDLRDDDAAAEARTRLIEHYLGDVSPGAGTRRFVEACVEVMARFEAERSRIRSSTTR